MAWSVAASCNVKEPISVELIIVGLVLQPSFSYTWSWKELQCILHLFFNTFKKVHMYFFYKLSYIFRNK